MENFFRELTISGEVALFNFHHLFPLEALFDAPILKVTKWAKDLKSNLHGKDVKTSKLSPTSLCTSTAHRYSNHYKNFNSLSCLPSSYRMDRIVVSQISYQRTDIPADIFDARTTAEEVKYQNDSFQLQ